ncbi:MAG: hypothetical protein CME02_08005 [Geminicoccus sp.]|nr:hypothetical protein [Geminicoccus sp.]
MARVIAITGIDGSGKTSTAKSLRRSLADAGFSTRYQHQFDSIFARVLNAMRPARTTKPTKTPATKDGDPASRHPRKASPLQRFTAYAFLLVQAIAANRARLSRQDFLVFDRYVYDDFVRLRQRYAISERYFSIIEKLVPRPLLLVTLEGDERVTYDRQVDIDTPFERYSEKLRIHTATMDKLRRLGLPCLAIDTTTNAPVEVLQMIMQTLGETGLR